MASGARVVPLAGSEIVLRSALHADASLTKEQYWLTAVLSRCLLLGGLPANRGQRTFVTA